MMKELKNHITPLMGTDDDYDGILAMARTARFVLIGEASHGTHEFYQIRAVITQRLIAEQDFMAVAVEADWPDAYRVNRYVKGDAVIDNAEDALSDFQRFPQWMWRNTEVRNFVDWLYDYHHAAEKQVPVGFYGLDLYSLNTSIKSVIHYLEQVDPAAAWRARHRYGCFDAFENNPQRYGYITSLNLDPGCEQEVIAQLKEMQQRNFASFLKNGISQDDFFSATQNARLVADAEHYYRAMFKGRPSSWNIRDRHMADTLNALADYLTEKYHKPAKIVVWAHNSHLGDASATDMRKRGEINIGQLVRERYPQETFLIGFSTYHGTVTAASDWDQPEENKPVREALEDSIEAVFHAMPVKDFWLNLREPKVQELLAEQRLQRFIGVIYRPDTERWSHYYHVQLPQEFDVIIHLDKTRALTPLRPGHRWTQTFREFEETYPTGI